MNGLKDKRCVNLGCGDNVIKGFENYDYLPCDDSVVFIDLNILPLPFDDDSVDELVLSQTLEHLDVNPYSFIKDCYRILKKDGVFMVGLPCFSFKLYHNRCFHPISYMNPVIKSVGMGEYVVYNDGKVKKNNLTFLGDKQFYCDKIKYKFRPFLFLRRLYEFVIAMGSETIEWYLRK